MPILTSRALTPGALAVGASTRGVAALAGRVAAWAQARAGEVAMTMEASPRNRRLFISPHLHRVVGAAQGGHERIYVHEDRRVAVARHVARDQIPLVRAPAETIERLEAEHLLDQERQLHALPLHHHGTRLAAP